MAFCRIFPTLGNKQEHLKSKKLWWVFFFWKINAEYGCQMTWNFHDSGPAEQFFKCGGGGGGGGVRGKFDCSLFVDV